MGKYFCLNLHDIHTSHNLGLKLGYPTPLCPTFAKLYFRCYVSKSPIGNQKSAISMEGNPIWTMSKSGIELRSHIKEYDLIKQGQKRLKRWAVLFTCMTIQCVHLEVVDSCATDAFISALR